MQSNVESTLSQLRTKYWTVKERQKFKTILKTSVICRLCQFTTRFTTLAKLSRFI